MVPATPFLHHFWSQCYSHQYLLCSLFFRPENRSFRTTQQCPGPTKTASKALWTIHVPVLILSSLPDCEAQVLLNSCFHGPSKIVAARTTWQTTICVGCIPLSSKIGTSKAGAVPFQSLSFGHSSLAPEDHWGFLYICMVTFHLHLIVFDFLYLNDCGLTEWYSDWLCISEFTLSCRYSFESQTPHPSG